MVRLIHWTGKYASWLTTMLVVLVVGDVFLRYLFSSSFAWLTDLEWHVFALIFLLGGAYGLAEDKHVRVDVFYSNWSVRRKAWVNIIGIVFLLIPWCLIVIYTSFTYAENAFAIGEKSSEPGGLPARWIIKGAITLGFLLLLLQAILSLVRHIGVLSDEKGLA